MPRPFSRLTAPLGETFGHRDAQVKVRAQLNTAQVVTVTGPIGVGKSRVAALVAADYATARGAPAWAYRIGSDASVDDALMRLSMHDAAKIAVLHLDGAEVDLPLAETLCAQWIAVDQKRRVIVSTRQTSSRFGDDRVTLAPLSLDDAIRLFIARAEGAGADVSRASRSDISAIVSDLDCLPLAVELCAAQAVVLDVSALKVHFEAPHARLDAVHRGDSLRHVIAAAVELLSPDAAACFMRCGLFHGRFAFESAQAVAGATLPVWQTLCARGLVQATTTPRGRRFWLYGPVRDYARSGDLSLADDAAHRAHYVRAAIVDDDERAANLLEAARRASLRGAREDARDALVAATGVVIDVGQARAALTHWSMVWATAPAASHRSSRGRLSLACGALASAADDLDAACASLAASLPTGAAGATLHADTLIARGTVRRFGGDIEGASSDYRAALALEDVSGATAALAEERWGGLLFEQGELDAAAEHLSRARRRYNDIGDSAGIARVGQAQGIVAQEAGDFASARSAFEAAAQAHHERGHFRFAAIARFDLGALTLEEGAPRRAEDVLREAAAELDDVGDERQAAFARALLAVCAHARGASGEAGDLLLRAEEATRKSGDRGYREAVRHCRLIVDAEAAAADAEKALRETPRTDEGRYTQRLLRAARRTDAAHVLELSPDGGRIVFGDQAIMLKSKAARRILIALCRQCQRDPKATLPPAELYAAGWPGEKTLTAAAKNRLQVALSALRKAGCSDIIVRVHSGYQISSNTRVRFVDDAS